MPLDGDRRASMRAGVKTLRFTVFPRNAGMLEDGKERWSLNPPGARGRTRIDSQVVVFIAFLTGTLNANTRICTRICGYGAGSSPNC